MSSTLREIRSFLTASVLHRRFWIIFGAMVVLFAIVGPLGTFERLALPTRLVYWFATMIGSWAIAIVTIAILHGFFSGGRYPGLGIVLAGAALASVPMAVYLVWVVGLFITLPSGFGFLDQLIYALPISLAFGVITYFALADGSDPEPISTSRAHLLLDRLPPGKRGSVKYLSMQDHYVQVTTTRGRELVLMRMSDAVGALADTPGIQIHRSHWIARDHVVSSRRENGQTFIIMDDGAQLPVSRSHVKAAREAGMI